MKLDINNYFSREMSMQYMGFSQYKSFMECPAKAMAEINGEYVRQNTTALTAGSYIDSYFDGTMNKFLETNPEMFKKNGELLKIYSDLELVINTIYSDSVLLKHCTGEQQVIKTGYIAGVPFKIMIDSMLDDMTVDRKVMADFKDKWSEEEFAKIAWWKVYRYDIQAFIYQTIRSQNEDGIIKPFVLAAVTKEKQPDKKLCRFSENTLKNAAVEVSHYAPIFNAIKQGKIPVTYCCKCDYCKSLKKLKENEYEDI